MQKESTVTYCEVCKRDVGVVYVRPWFGVIIYLIIGVISFLIPMVGCFIFPVFLLLATIHYKRHSKKVCGICKSQLK